MRISDWSSDVCSSDLEGVTEFLPISSTGHLIVISDWLSMDRTETQTAFEIIIQLAAILAVIANYGGKFTPSHIGLWQKIGLSFIPIGAVGFLFGDAVELGRASCRDSVCQSV